MAKIDDLTTQFQQLDTAVRRLLASIPGTVATLESELATLRADDAIEDSQLDGLSSAAADLRGAVEAFGEQTDVPVDLPPAPDDAAPV